MGIADYFKGKDFGDIHKDYDSIKKNLVKDISHLDKMTASKVVDINAYKRQRAVAVAHYQNLIDVVEQLQDRLEKASDKEREGIRKDLKYYISSLKSIESQYRKFLDDAKKKGIRLGLKELKEEEQSLAKEGESLEHKLGKTAALFLLISSSASFSYALANTIFNSDNITGATIGVILSNNAPSLLLSTITLILIILLVSPFDSMKGLFKKKRK